MILLSDNGALSKIIKCKSHLSEWVVNVSVLIFFIRSYALDELWHEDGRQVLMHAIKMV